MSVIVAILTSAAGSAALLAAILLYYGQVARSYRRRRRFERDLWWLPAWESWRFVIKNIGGKRPLLQVRYRAWLTRVESSRDGSSVDTFVDYDLEQGERELLTVKQDLPVVCFRVERRGGAFVFVHTNKLGTPLSEHPLEPSAEYHLRAEYSFTTRTFAEFPIQVTRFLNLPRFVNLKTGGCVDLFEYLWRKQQSEETSVPLVFTYGEEISVPPL